MIASEYDHFSSMQVLYDINIPPYIVFPYITVIQCDVLVFVSIMNVQTCFISYVEHREGQRSAPPTFTKRRHPNVHVTLFTYNNIISIQV